jgi:YidC/Oxa1 family membrane protein insertase
MNIFEILFYQPIYNLIVIFYHLLGDNLGLAIIAIAVFSRVILIPLTRRQIKMAESSREFSEKSKEIKKKHKNNKEKQTEELLKLQQEYLPAQIGGCLPLIFQLIVFINIYSVIRNLIQEGASGFNEIAYSFVPKFTSDVNVNFLGNLFDLKIAPNSAESSEILPYIVLLLLVGVTQYSSLKIMTGMRNRKKEEAEKSKKQEKKKNKDKKEPEDFGEIMQRSTQQAMLIFPFLLMFISYGLPAGLSIYLITTSSFVILQQSVLYYIQRRKEKSE